MLYSRYVVLSTFNRFCYHRTFIQYKTKIIYYNEANLKVLYNIKYIFIVINIHSNMQDRDRALYNYKKWSDLKRLFMHSMVTYRNRANLQKLNKSTYHNWSLYLFKKGSKLFLSH